MQKSKLLIIALILSMKLISQKKKIFNPVTIWAITHPLSASKIKKIHRECQVIYQNKELKQRLDSFANGGKIDAFRHIFFMVAFHQKVKTSALRKLGIAHENQNYRQYLKGEENGEWRHDSLSMVMDLYNNEVALQVNATSEKIPLEELKEQVIQIIQNGKALILKRNQKGDLIRCDGSLIHKGEFSDAWYIPKCLVSSDYIYKD